jgi:Arc/MetJ-type ribon-helix-helix transcriptional regulator
MSYTEQSREDEITITVRLKGPLNRAARRRMNQAGYSTISEYVRNLIRTDAHRRKEDADEGLATADA